VPAFKLFRTVAGWIVDTGERRVRLSAEAAVGLTTRDDLTAFLASTAAALPPLEVVAVPPRLLPPVERQEVWAAGVTYFRSRTARMEESKVAAGSQFYDLVYNADRPELFFKAAAWRVVPSGHPVRIRRDASWNVPEPELALLVSPSGRILGYTAGNDMSSRDIEGENPLYLPQAKIYDGSCALGPALVVSDDLPPPATSIAMEIRRSGAAVFSGTTTLARMKRDLSSLVAYLYRETSFPEGCVLLTGTGVVPPDDFTLQRGDEILIAVDEVGTLQNIVD
jgi:2-dehydro-3-deoxy-D-arabinonate dehydratase